MTDDLHSLILSAGGRHTCFSSGSARFSGLALPGSLNIQQVTMSDIEIIGARILEIVSMHAFPGQYLGLVHDLSLGIKFLPAYLMLDILKDIAHAYD